MNGIMEVVERKLAWRDIDECLYEEEDYMNGVYHLPNILGELEYIGTEGVMFRYGDVSLEDLTKILVCDLYHLDAEWEALSPAGREIAKKILLLFNTAVAIEAL